MGIGEKMRDRIEYAEPYRIKMVEMIEQKSEAYRKDAIRAAGYNVFNLKAEDVYIDLLTDSGTGAMSNKQWAKIFLGDESYAGAKSYYNFAGAVRDIFGYEYVVAAHQGRAAENILMGVFVSEGQRVPGNMHFDTTEGHIKLRKAIPVNLLKQEGYDTSLDLPFKGDIDLDLLKAELEAGAAGGKIPFVIMTVTCNSNGGQPVSMENIRAASELTHSYGIPFFFDAARYAENCYFIKTREKGYADKSLIEIAREMFSYGDGATMSCKKDALVNIGGFFAIKDRSDYYELASQKQIQYEGFKTYGGLAGRDLEAIAEGLYEGLDEAWLEERIGQVKYLGDRLNELGVPMQIPFGGHGIFIDAEKFLPDLPRSAFPAQSLTVALYEKGGVRAVEIGSSAFGYKDPETGEEVLPELEMVRLAIPRRTYSDRHMDLVVNTMEQIKKEKENIKGMRMVYAPEIMRHFTARFEPIV